MSSSGIRKEESTDSRTKKAILDREEDLINSYKILDEATSLSSLAGGGEQSSGEGSAPGNFMERLGNTWLGQYGNQFEIVTIENGQLNISRQSGSSSPLLVVNPEGGSADFLDRFIPGEDILFYQEHLIHTVIDTITIRPKLTLPITNIVGNGIDNIITVTVADTSKLTTGDKVVISNTTNFDIVDGIITVTGGTTFTYDLGSIGNATPENSGDVDRGNIKTQDGEDLVCPVNSIVHFIFNTVTQLFSIDASTVAVSGEVFSGNLSDLIIDVNKDWNGKSINNLAGLDLFANLQANPINNVDHISFISDLAATRGQIGRSDFFGTSNGVTINIPVSQNFVVSVDTVEKLKLDATNNVLIAGVDFDMLTNNIKAGGAGEGVTNIGHLDFIDNLATPAASVSLYSDGTDLLANTGGGVVNISDIGGGVFLDSTFRIQGSGDQTKQLAFEVDGFTTATTRTFTMPNTDGTVFLASAVQNLVMGNNDIISSAGNGMTSIGHLDFVDNLATPVSPLSIYSDGTDMLVNTGGIVINLSDIGGGVFLDSTFRIQGSGDQTKQLAFEVDGFTTATTRTFSLPDANGEILVNPSQTDWDLNSHDIFGIDSLTFLSTPGSLSSLNVGFSALGSGGFRANILNNGNFQLTEENIIHFEFNGISNAVRVIDSLFNVEETIGSTAFAISKFNGRTEFNEPTQIDFDIGAVKQFQITDGQILFSGSKGIIANVSQIGFNVIGNIIEDDANGMIFKTPVSDDFTWSDGTTTFAVLDVDGLFLNQLFIQLTGIPSPGPTGSPSVGEIFLDSNNSFHLSIIRNGSVIDLEAGGAGEVNTASNVGTGVGKVFKTKVGVDLQFKSILAGQNMNVVNGTDDIQINSINDGIQEAEPPLEDETTQFEFQMFISNGKQGYEVSKTTVVGEDNAVFVPIYLGKRARITHLGWVNIAAATGTITFAMGLYANRTDGQNYPGSLIVQDTSATVTAATQTALTNSLTPTNLEPGLYWIALIPTNLQIGSQITLSRHDSAGANSAGYFDDEGNTDVILSLLGFAEPETSLPGTPANEMTPLVENPPALFARFIPNTS